MRTIWLLLIIPVTLIIGVAIGIILMSWHLANKLRKELGFKNMKEFVEQAKKAQELQKKMKKEGIFGAMNDPELRKQIEEFQRRFGGQDNQNEDSH